MYLPYSSDIHQISQFPSTDKCIVLDLDETLVHSNENINTLFELGIYSNPDLIDLRRRTYSIQLDDVIDKNGKGVKTELWGITRPYYKEFLIFCFSYFKIVAVWSAGQRKYVDAIVDYLFKDLKRPHVVYSYDECEQTQNRHLVKPLTKMFNNVPLLNNYMSLNNSFVIDDRTSTFKSVNPYNGIKIPAYRPKFTLKSLRKHDNALLQLINWFSSPPVYQSQNIQYLNKQNIFN